MRLSVVWPSAWAWKLVLMRCRSTGMATLRMSSSATLNRPSIAAIALPPWIRFWPARGPGAPIDQLLDELRAPAGRPAGSRAPAGRRT